MKTIALSLTFLSSLAASADVTYHRQIAPIIGQKCLGCHGARPVGAPFSLASYADLASRADLVEQSVVDRSMPPMAVNNSGSCQNFTNASWMTDAEISMIQDWVAQGAPEGDVSTAAEVPGPELQASLDRVDAVVGMKKPYTPPAGADELRCFLVDAPVKEDRFLTGFNMIPGDLGKAHGGRVHHAILWLPDYWGQWIALWQDLKTPGMGYPCFGSALSTAYPVAVWAPGSGAVLYPKGTGIKVPARRKMILQVHYSNSLSGGEPPEPTRTAAELQLEPSVDKELEVMLAGRISGVTIPPGQEAWEFGRTFKIMVGASERGQIPPFDIYGVFPHMHLYGKDMRLELVRGGTGERTCAMDAFRWDFNHQRSYFYDKPVSANDGDELAIRCRYDTTSATEPIVFGDASSNEMCIGGMYVVWR